MNEELSTKKGLEKELADARASLMDISAVHSQCLEKSRVHDKDNKSVELLTKEIEDLKKQAQLKKTKYTENLQFAKSRMDMLKDQNIQLKQIIQQHKEDKNQLKEQIKSLEQVNLKQKAEIKAVSTE